MVASEDEQNYSALSRKSDDELIQLVHDKGAASGKGQTAKFVLEMRTAAAMRCSANRLEFATWILLVATILMLIAVIVQIVWR
jgi:hypothetical protein